MTKILTFLFLLVSATSCSQNIEKSKAIKSEQILEFELENSFTGYKKGMRKNANGFGADEMIIYDKNGNVLMVYHLSLNIKPTLKQKYTYNSANKPVSLIAYNDKGVATYTTTYQYDEEKRITRVEFIIGQNTVGYKSSLSLYEYKSNNDYVIFYSEMDENTHTYQLNNKQFIKTDQHQNIIEKRFFSPENEMYREEYNDYDTQHHLVASRTKDQWDDTKTNYFYDDNHNLIKTIDTSKDHTNQTNYEYSFDQYGNWLTKKVINKNGSEQSYFERTLVYY